MPSAPYRPAPPGALLLSLILLLACTGTAPGRSEGSSGWLDRARGAASAVLRGAEGASGASLREGDLARGLGEALRVATGRAVEQVGAEGGYLADPEIHIPLPETLGRVQSALRKVGLAGMADDLERRLNRAAEAAAPEARTLFVDAIREMRFADARRILEGPDDAATRYFRGAMSEPLAERMRPIIRDSLSQVGALRSYDAMMQEYAALPFVPDVKADLTDYTIAQALDGLFHVVAEEEARIRADPAARTTELLRRVFGAS